jgi:dihydrofolate synthase/folylpolyglutamate synthase
MEILGDSLEQLAYEKAGIIKKGIPLFTTEQNPSRLNVFQSACREKSSPFIPLSFPDDVEFDSRGACFTLDSLALEISMKGPHQVQNATLAYWILNHLRQSGSFEISDEALALGMKKAFWKGRFELVQQDPPVVLDGAHNIEGIQMLKETVSKLYPERKKIFVMSVLSNKDYDEMFQIIGGIADEIHFTSFDFPKAQTAKKQFEAYGAANAGYNEDFRQLISKLRTQLQKEECLIITGSLYFISQVRQWLNQES